MSAATSESDGAFSTIPVASTRFVRDQTTWLNYAACFYLLVIMGSIGPAMPFIRDQRGINLTTAGLHFSAVALGALTSAIFLTHIVRTLGRAGAFWASLAGVTTGGLLFTFAPMAVVSILGTMLIGASASLMTIVVQANLSERHPAHRAVALVEINVACSLGTIIAAFSVGLSERIGAGWQFAFVVPMALMMVAAFTMRSAPFASGRLPGVAHSQHGPLPQLFWVLCAIAALSSAGEWSLMYWGSDFLNGSGDVSKGAAAAMMSLFFIGMTTGRFVGSRLIQTLAPQRLLIAGLAIAIAGFPIFWLPQNTYLRLFCLLILGLGISNVYPTIASLSSTMLPRMIDIAFSRLQITGNIMILIAPFVLGVFGDEFGIKTAMSLVFPMMLSALLLTVWFNRQPTDTPELT
ncbi:MFS transporter [soil metagenome]